MKSASLCPYPLPHPTGLGGWYSYRMSKAALNMATRNLSIELGRSRPKVTFCSCSIFYLRNYRCFFLNPVENVFVAKRKSIYVCLFVNVYIWWLSEHFELLKVLFFRCFQVVCVSLHPGTVNTDLSRPYHKNVPNDKLFSAEHSVNCLMVIINSLSIEKTGKAYNWDGTELPW